MEVMDLLLVSYLQEAVLNLRWFITGHRVAGGRGLTPLSCGLTRALLLPFDIESLVAAVGHHSPKTVVCPTWVTICDAWWLSAPHRDALDRQGRRAPLSTSQAFNLRGGVQHKTLHALKAHYRASCKLCFTHRLQDAVGNGWGFFTEVSYAARHSLALWGNPVPLGIADELGIVSQAVTICTVVERSVSKEPVSRLWRGVVHIGGLVTGDGQALVVT